MIEDIPLIGILGRPAPSDESALQQNIVLGQTTVYPTLFDLMGLRWSKHVADVNHINLRDAQHIINGRNSAISHYVIERAEEEVDKALDIQRRAPRHYRPDLYHSHTNPSPHHPSGYLYPDAEPDPTGRNYRREDRRPEEYRIPAHDDVRGVPIDQSQFGRERIEEQPLERIEESSERRGSGHHHHHGRSPNSHHRNPSDHHRQHDGSRYLKSPHSKPPYWGGSGKRSHGDKHSKPHGRHDQSSLQFPEAPSYESRRTDVAPPMAPATSKVDTSIKLMNHERIAPKRSIIPSRIAPQSPTRIIYAEKEIKKEEPKKRSIFSRIFGRK